jgi:hypothetical protein
VAHAELGRVACVSVNQCWVGGYLEANNGNAHPVVEKWNGKVWASSTLPAVSGADKDTYVDSVTCVKASACYAMGGTGVNDSSPFSPVVFRWNGNRWSVMADVPMPKGYKSADVEEMRCTSSKSCVAEGIEIPTGSYFDHAYSDMFNGSRWSIHQMPQPYHATFAYSNAPDLACASATQCVAPLDAAADANGKTIFTPYLEQWNGTSWTLHKVPSKIAKSYGQFTDVACFARSRCWVTTANGIDEWTGGTSWDVGSTPQPAHASFDAVTCGPTSACFTVGVTAKGRTFADVIRRAAVKATRPVVKRIKPKAGRTAGGTKVLIIGHGFTKKTTVAFGKIKAVHVTDVSATRLKATSPSHPAGTVQIVVTSHGRHSAKVKADRFRYEHH